MKRTLVPLLLVILSSSFMSGCDGLGRSKKKTETAEKPVFNKVRDPELAKLILKPERKEWAQGRDPFEPLVLPKRSKTDGKKTASYAGNREPIDETEFLGVVRMDEEYAALLKTEIKRGAFKINDRFLGYTVAEIQPDKVVLTNGERTVTVQRNK